jgi:hypothetical protein
MSDEPNMIAPMHTPCLGCTFSIKDKQKQIGCQVGRIDKYKELGAEVINAYDDNGNEFFVVNNRLCVYKRDKNWAKETPKRERLDAVNRELRLKYHIMVHFNSTHDVSDLLNTLKSIDKQDNPPIILTIINRRRDVSQKDLVKIITAHNYKNFEWRLQTFFDDDATNRECLDVVIDNTKYEYKILFYISFHAGFEVPKVLSEELQKYVVTDMNKVAYGYANKEDNGELVNIAMHLKHAGNSFNIPIFEKLKEFEEGVELYMEKIQNICPSLKV